MADAHALSLVAQGKRIERRDYFTRLRSRVADPEDLFSYTKKTSAIYKGILNIIGYPIGGLRDWRSSAKIDADKPLDDHHIYPKGYLTSNPELDMDQAEVLQLLDCVVNRTLIPKNLNIVVGKRPPCEYLAELRKVNPKLEASLQDHLVPPELIADATWNGRFREFLDERAKAIMALIERYAIEPAKEMEARHLALPDAPAGTGTPERLARGMRTPESAFVVPILRALQSLGGRAPMHKVLEYVESEIKAELREVDHQPLKSDKNKPRWYNTAQWARNTMVEDGLLKKSRPY